MTLGLWLAAALCALGQTANLGVVKTDSPDPVVAGGTLTYSVTASNAGPDNATGVTVTDTLPAGVVFVSATPTQGICSEAGGVVTCTAGALANGASATITIAVTAPSAAGSINNTATISGAENDPDPSDNSDTEATTVTDPCAGETQAPVVTPPVSTTVDASICAGNLPGATGNSSLPLATFISAGSATDNCDATPTQLPAQVGGADIDNTTFFPVGTTTVTFRFMDDAGNIGSATADVTVDLFYGDLDEDNLINSVDAVILANFLVGNLTQGVPPFTAPLAAAELNNVGGVDSVDAVILANFLVGNITCLPVLNCIPPTMSISASGPTTFCDGGSVILTALPAGLASYLWNDGVTTQSRTVSASGSFFVHGTNSGGCSATSSPTVVTVNPIPAAPTISAGGPTDFCDGGSVVLTATAGYSSYLWSTGATTQAITVSASGSYTVQGTVSGCQSPASAATVVTVNPIPAAPTISAGGPLTFCDGGSVVLTATAGYTAYLWSNGATTQSITVAASGSFTVQGTVSGCTSPASAATVVTENPNPVSTITPDGPTTFCQGNVVTLQGPAGMASYVWKKDGVDVAFTQNFVVSLSGSYTLTVTNAQGCSNMSAQTVVTVNPLPSINSFTTDTNPVPPFGGATLSFAYANGTSWAITSSLGNTLTPSSGSSTTGGTANYSRDIAGGDDTLTLTVTGPCGVTTWTLVIN